MEKLFISGVIERDGNCERVADEEAEFFTIYRRENGPSFAVRDFATKELAESALRDMQLNRG